MTFDNYQDFCKTTAIYDERAKKIYPILGLLGEVGEFIEELMTKYKEDFDPLFLGILTGAVATGKDAEKLKKRIRDGKDGEVMQRLPKNFSMNEQEKIKIMKENSDIFWYLSAIATDLGYTMDEVAEANVAKLKSRQERGVLQGSGSDR